MNPLPCTRLCALLTVLFFVLPSSAFAANPFPTFNTTRYLIGASSTRFAIADFNQDGWHDVASLDGKDVVVRLGIGGGKLGDPQRTTLTGFANFVQAGDFNGDGKVDLAVSHSVEKKISIMLGKGDGTFNVTALATSGSPQVLAVGDYNRDGKADFVIELDDPAGSALHFYRGNGDGTFIPSVGISCGSDGVELLSADVNRDGKPDLVQTFGGSVFVYFGNGDGTFIFHQQLVRTDQTNNGGNLGAVLADLNQDAVPDLALAVNAPCGHGCSPYVAVETWMNDGKGNFSRFQVIPPAGTDVLGGPVVGDFDGDHVIDLAYLDFSFEFKLAIARGNGFGGFFRPVLSESYGSAAAAKLAVSDMDNDGLHDIIALTATEGLAVSLNRSATSTCAAPDSYPLQAKICRVANGKTAWSPFVVEGVGNGPTKVARMEVWLDGSKVHQVIGDHLLHTIYAIPGSHRLVIAAYDEFGNKGSSGVIFSVSDGPCIPSGNERTVTVCSAAPDATIFNPLRIRAAVRDSQPVAAIQVYIHSFKVYEAKNVRVIDFSTGLFLGPHPIVVKAWDALGQFAKSYTVTTLTGCPASGPDRAVTICSPVDGQDISLGSFGGSSFIPVFASATGPVHTMQAYVDGVLRESVAGATIELGIGVGSGRHRLTIKAWDKNGSFSKTVFVVAP